MRERQISSCVALAPPDTSEYVPVSNLQNLGPIQRDTKLRERKRESVAQRETGATFTEVTSLSQQISHPPE